MPPAEVMDGGVAHGVRPRRQRAVPPAHQRHPDAGDAVDLAVEQRAA